MRELCSIPDCDEIARYLDLMDNPMCEECVEREVNDGESSWDDFELID